MNKLNTNKSSQKTKSIYLVCHYFKDSLYFY